MCGLSEENRVIFIPYFNLLNDICFVFEPEWLKLIRIIDTTDHKHRIAPLQNANCIQ